MSKPWSGVVREGDGASGSFKEALTGGHPKGSQVSMDHAGFRARKNAMHEQDGMNDRDIEDRSKGDEAETSGRPDNEEKETVDEGTKQEPGLEPRR